MKGRIFFLLFSSILLVILVSGCQFTIPNKLTGPTWTTKLSVPLIARAKNSDGSTNSELRLDGGVNGLGETGVNLVGTNLSNFNIPPTELNGGEFGTMAINVDPLTTNITSITNLPLCTDQSITQSQSISLGNYTGMALSGNFQDGVKNTITISIINGKAGSGNLTISLGGRSVTILSGSSIGYLPINNLNLSDTLTLDIDGTITITTSPGSIAFDFSPTLEVGQFTVSASNINDPTVKDKMTIPGQEAPLSLGGSGTILQLSNLQFIVEAPALPENLKATLPITLSTRDTETGPDILTLSFTKDLDKNNPATLDFTDAGINNLLASNPAYLIFKIGAITFGAVNAAQDIVIKSADKIAIKFTPKIGLESVTTGVQSTDVPKVVQDFVQTASLVIETTNNTPLGLTLTAYLSPDPDPKNDPNNTTFVITIPSADPGVPKTAKSTLSITAAQLAYLTGGAAGKLYNQIEVVNTNIAAQAVQATPSPYLEIRSYAQAELLVNKQQ